LVFDGGSWRDLGHYARTLDRLSRLGIGTAPDDLNRLSAKVNASLFSALTTEEGGTGDLRFVLNKGGAGNVLSQVYQREFRGRAETGLIGSDDFSLRVSPDGSQWRDAMIVDHATARVSFPGGLASLPGRNLLTNADCRINQRAFGGGALSAGAFGYDRWRAGPGGCTLNRASDGSITLTGALDQVIDLDLIDTGGGIGGLAGATLTFSVQNLSASLQISVGTKTALLPAGGGPVSATLILDGAETGNITVRLQATGPCTFKRPKLEIGSFATPWEATHNDIEELRCRRYYQRLAITGNSPAILAALGQRIGSSIIDVPYVIPIPMRSSPSIVTSGFSWAAGLPSGNQVAFHNPASASWATLAGTLSLSPALTPASTSILLRFQATSTISGSTGQVGHIYLGGSAYIALQAEL
jgi:hypothetical protein